MKKSRREREQPKQKETKKSSKEDFPFPELEEIKNGFDLFDVKHKGKIDPKELCDTMKEMKMDEKYPYLYSIISEIENEFSYEELIELINKKMEEEPNEENLRKLFDFFLEDSGGDKLPLHTFVRMAKELREETTEEELRQLLTLSGCTGDELTFEEFCVIMNEGGFNK
ncbi:MAG: hypothetical protein MJ252_25790 [archaeon]|nr:hypothetical protein [archaeon]